MAGLWWGGLGSAVMKRLLSVVLVVACGVVSACTGGSGGDAVLTTVPRASTTVFAWPDPTSTTTVPATTVPSTTTTTPTATAAPSSTTVDSGSSATSVPPGSSIAPDFEVPSDDVAEAVALAAERAAYAYLEMARDPENAALQLAMSAQMHPDFQRVEQAVQTFSEGGYHLVKNGDDPSSYLAIRTSVVTSGFDASVSVCAHDTDAVRYPAEGRRTEFHAGPNYLLTFSMRKHEGQWLLVDNSFDTDLPKGQPCEQ